MSNDLRTAAQQALETPGCERLREWASIGPVQRAAVESFLRAALEQPEQEPLFVVEGGELRPLRPALLNDGDKLYTHPPRREWQGLTDDEISALFPSSLRSDYKPYSFARAIEQACKERNT